MEMKSKSLFKNKNNKSKAFAKVLQNSTVLQVKKFQNKIAALHGFCESKGVFTYLKECELDYPYAAFVSVGNTSSRAMVFSASGETAETAWQQAVSKAEEYLQKAPYVVDFVKVDLVDTVLPATLDGINEVLRNTKKSFFRYGISFDHSFESAFLEQELNTARLAIYGEKGGLSRKRINEYLQERKHNVLEKLPQDILVFSCVAAIADQDDSVHLLYDDGYAYGRREIETVDDALLDHILTTSGTQLSNMLEKTGMFQYGYFADLDQKIPSYNIVRHVAAIWALLMHYSRNPNEKLKERIEAAITYAIQTAIEEKDGAAFVVEHASNEIKLGANAVAIISLVTYTDIMQDEKYVPLAQKLAEGILRCQNPDGDWWHILSYPEAERKEKYRIVYYDGEATFALAKLYGLTKEEKWLQAAQRSVEYFIRNDYTKYRDHWVAYSVNEVTKYNPDKRYFDFALQNVEKNILRVYKQDTSYHTYLEMLMASFETLIRM
ncbi:MAG: hypothetical protein IKU21_07965, partial [Anaerotignum sp.]|nr:hypothetical protein [Anaerotignum sp.]